MSNLFAKIGNHVMTLLLRSPLHVLVSDSFMLICVKGRKTGKVYTIPVEYKEGKEQLFVLTHRDRTWWKNLTNGAPVQLWLHGHEIAASAHVLSLDEAELFPAIRTRYRWMSDEKVSELSRCSLIVQINLAQAEPVKAM